MARLLGMLHSIYLTLQCLPTITAFDRKQIGINPFSPISETLCQFKHKWLGLGVFNVKVCHLLSTLRCYSPNIIMSAIVHEIYDSFSTCFKRMNFSLTNVHYYDISLVKQRQNLKFWYPAPLSWFTDPFGIFIWLLLTSKEAPIILLRLSLDQRSHGLTHFLCICRIPQCPANCVE